MANTATATPPAGTTPGATPIPTPIPTAAPLPTDTDTAAASVDSPAPVAPTGVSSTSTGAGSGTSTSSPTGMIGAPSSEVSNWYRNNVGRDPDAGGGAFWDNAIKTQGAAAAYSGFLKSLGQDGEASKNLTMDQAAGNYTGPTSSFGASNVDEWAKNVFGRAATSDEIAQYGAAKTPEEAQHLYAQFVQSGTAAGGTARPMDMLAASQLGGQPVAKGPYNGMIGQFNPDLNRQVDPATMTIEGRIKNLTATDANGNYTNPNVRQAVERTMQSYNARGMLNSSMAQQAAQEAAISKAIEIAGPDAQTYFQQGRANQDATNTFANNEQQQAYNERNQAASFANQGSLQDKQIAADTAARLGTQDFTAGQTAVQQAFTTRQNYQQLTDNANARYQTAVQQINASNMNPEDRSVAIAQAGAARDGELVYVNKVFSAVPNFQSAWLTSAVSLGITPIEQITDPNVLANLANDPAQPPEVRAKAQARLASLPPPAPKQPGMIGEGSNTGATAGGQ